MDAKKKDTVVNVFFSGEGRGELCGSLSSRLVMKRPTSSDTSETPPPPSKKARAAANASRVAELGNMLFDPSTWDGMGGMMRAHLFTQPAWTLDMDAWTKVSYSLVSTAAQREAATSILLPADVTRRAYRSRASRLIKMARELKLRPGHFVRFYFGHASVHDRRKHPTVWAYAEWIRGGRDHGLPTIVTTTILQEKWCAPLALNLDEMGKTGIITSVTSEEYRNISARHNEVFQYIVDCDDAEAFRHYTTRHGPGRTDCEWVIVAALGHAPEYLSAICDEYVKTEVGVTLIHGLLEHGYTNTAAALCRPATMTPNDLQRIMCHPGIDKAVVARTMSMHDTARTAILLLAAGETELWAEHLHTLPYNPNWRNVAFDECGIVLCAKIVAALKGHPGFRRVHPSITHIVRGYRPPCLELLDLSSLEPNQRDDAWINGLIQNLLNHGALDTLRVLWDAYMTPHLKNTAGGNVTLYGFVLTTVMKYHAEWIVRNMLPVFEARRQKPPSLGYKTVGKSGHLPRGYLKKSVYPLIFRVYDLWPSHASALINSAIEERNVLLLEYMLHTLRVIRDQGAVDTIKQMLRDAGQYDPETSCFGAMCTMEAVKPFLVIIPEYQ